MCTSSPEIAEALLAKGADVEAKSNMVIARACPSVHLAHSLTHMQNAHGYL